MAKPRIRVAVAFARSFAAGLVQNCEPGFQQDTTNLTDEEMDIVNKEIERLYERLQAMVNEDDLAKCQLDDAEEGEHK